MTRRRVLQVGGACLGAVVLLVASYLILLVASPYASEPVPTGCTTDVSHIPSTANYDIPEVGPGVLLTGDAQTAVAMVASYGQTPFTADVYIVSKTRSNVLQRFRFTNDVLAATIHAGRIYLFNDKIGYFMDAASGQTVHTSVESDNYRGLFLSNGVRHVQSDFVFSALGPGRNVVFNLHLKFAVIAYGCVIA
jgi:hypothetical protein